MRTLALDLIHEFNDIVGEAPTEFFTRALRVGADGMDEANLIIQRAIYETGDRS
ncbi:hypothetical protein ACQR1W_23705 [Bradyrhizobium sp. HKCCYLS1011]|uniref:hypothetical protein n=1 Tax=Bradyrhizobium sp. HKCCYLS1011 TaxID=3420733 RepID=UPI003EBE9CF9